MSKLVDGARQLPRHHITIRVPWHDGGWDGTVCSRPLDNTSCLALKQIGASRRDEFEKGSAGKRLDDLVPADWPPCVLERASFMAPFQLSLTKRHPYTDLAPSTHGHFVPTGFDQPSYSAACVPYRWMLRNTVEGNADKREIGLAEQLRLGYIPDREPDIRNSKGSKFRTSWIQEKDNQLSLLDTFFSALRADESLCFFYAKETPLSEKSGRVIVGVGRVISVGEATEYAYDNNQPSVRSVLWERNVHHSIRPRFLDGFLFPTRKIAQLAEQDDLDPEEFVAFAPSEFHESYSYGSELLTDDGAVASLVKCAAALRRISEHIEGPWNQVLAWVDSQLNRLWQARGAYPGLGSALSAFGYEWGFQHGSLLAYEVQMLGERTGESDGWKLVDRVMGTPALLDGPTAQLLTDGLRGGWRRLPLERRKLLQLLSRCALTESQAFRFYDSTERAKKGIQATDDALLANPYLLFELDRRAEAEDPIAFPVVDRGAFPDDAIRQKYPVTKPSRVEDPTDKRRVRALVVDLLEEGAAQGHTLLPRSRIIEQARERALRPPCPLGENVLDVMEECFGPIIACTKTKAGETAYQVDWLSKCRSIISREVSKRKSGRGHAASHDWSNLVAADLESLPEDALEQDIELRARKEKAAALEVIFRSRISVLVGSAGTGKTTLLRALCRLPDIRTKGILLLAPTGKARVRLEEQTKLRGAGKTLAQFLNGLRRYENRTGRYFPNPHAPRCGDYRTVLVDECSMLTEEQLAALIDSLANVERLVLVGDPRKLPPNGAGRPFVDIVRELKPPDVDALFPRCSNSYAELTIPRRQQGRVLPDVLLASHFNGQPLDPGADAVLDQIGSANGKLRLVQWDHNQDLQQKIIDELVRELHLSGSRDELGFEESLGGSRFAHVHYAFFRHKFGQHSGAAEKAENWQILSPLRAGQVGVDALNREIQTHFRQGIRQLSEKGRKVPKPLGPQSLFYGDKVISVRNQRRKDVYPALEGEAYIANGDIGMIVGQYKGPQAKYRGLPWKLEVEFAGQLGHKYGFEKWEFGDEKHNPLELAYCLTIHKTQGSEFNTTFVVLPNPCWLLSRELLYTALTRHREKIVILHQGPWTDYRRYVGDEYSEVAKRMTNLFSAPAPREVFVGTRSRFLEEGLIHRTERGDLVRSKSELVIADKLYARGIEYLYEEPLPLSEGCLRYPDFTINDPDGKTYYWEHLGLLDDPGYHDRWKQKRAEYLKAGLVPLDCVNDAQCVLIETSDKSGGGLNAQHIAELIDKVFMT